MSAAATKFFRVAVAGPTVDGRNIEPAWLTEMAASYNPATYAARVNMEHVRGVTADKPFKALGDVVALKTDTIDLEIGGKSEKRVALFAQIAPTADLLAMNKDGQKLYSSIEVNPAFAGTDKAYCVGLAVTDSPASLGTDRLQFAVKSCGNLFSSAIETAIEVDAATAPAGDAESTRMFKAVTDFFSGLGKAKDATPPVQQQPVTPPPANDNAALMAALGDGFGKLTAAFEAQGRELAAGTKKVADDLASFRTEIEGTDADQGTRRKPAPGGDASAFSKVAW